MTNHNPAPSPLEPRQIKRVNWVGLRTLVMRETSRFLAVYTQTIIAPVITTLLFYTVFALAFGGITKTVANVPFLLFLAPGLMMMTMVQNAFANTSSSMIISKVQGNIVDVLMPPLSAGEFVTGYITGALLRGLCVGFVTFIAVRIFVDLPVTSVPTIITFAVLGNIMLASLGLIAGIWSEKFDHIAVVTNFIVTPLTFLSGTFYSLERLPDMWRELAHYNPFFFMIDGFRSGFIGYADGDPALGVIVLIVIDIILISTALRMVHTGYKIKT